MQKKYWYHVIRFNLLLALCTILLLTPGLFARPQSAQAREAAANPDRLAYLPTHSGLSVVKWTGWVGVFVIGPNGAIFHKALEDGQWSPSWFSLGSPPSGNTYFGSVDAVSWGTNRIDVFGMDYNNIIWHKAWNGTSWGSWANLGGGICCSGGTEFSGGIQAVSMGSGRIDLFTSRMGTCIAYNNCSGQPFKHKWLQNGTWKPSQTGWEVLDSSMFGEVQVFSPSANRIQIFSIENSETGPGPFYRKRWNGLQWVPGTDQWTPLNGSGHSVPFGVAWNSTRLDVFARGGDYAIWHNSSSDSGVNWAGWSTLGGAGSIGSTPPTAVAWGPNRLDIFDTKSVSGTTETYHKWWDGSAWGPSQTGAWQWIGNVPITGAIEAVSWEVGRFDLFGRASNGDVFHKWWGGGNWGPAVDQWANIGHP